MIILYEAPVTEHMYPNRCVPHVKSKSHHDCELVGSCSIATCGLENGRHAAEKLGHVNWPYHAINKYQREGGGLHWNPVGHRTNFIAFYTGATGNTIKCVAMRPL